MRNQNKWKPSKFISKYGKLSASYHSEKIHPGSRLYATLLARSYDLGIRKHASGKLIDLGCGDVPLFQTYRDFVDQVFCVDWNDSIYIDFKCDLSQALPLVSNFFDTLILSEVLEHIPTPEQLWPEMSRILKPGGRLFISVPFYYGIHEAPHDYYRYTEHALRRFAHQAGMKIIVLEPLGGTPEILADLLAKHITVIPLIGILISKLIQRIALTFVRTSIGKKVSKKTSPHFPLGYFLVAEKNL